MQAHITPTAVVGRKIIPIVPYAVKGRYRTLKTAILSLALGVYFLLPWLVWHGSARSGQPLLIDLAHSRVLLLDIVLYPQDLMILMAVMVFAATLLFMAAAMYGRIFCGFFCFQTIWTDAFRYIELLVQGEAQARIRLMKQPWGWEKAYKLITTHALWLLLALATGVTFTLYFADARSLLADILHGEAVFAAYFTMATLTATTYAAAGIAREDICRVACPYGKFQTVMQDPTTRTVTYDSARGERSQGRAVPTRALRVASTREQQGVGDCIDCGYCVNVCPTGVDIRKGFQIDCISCGLCIDACDHIMRAVELPTGLIRFDRMATGATTAESRRWASVKTTGYLALLLLCSGFIAYQLAHLSPFSAIVQQQGQPLVSVMSNGDLKSRFSVRVTNKTSQDQAYHIEAQGLPAYSLGGTTQFRVPAGKTYSYAVNTVMSAQHAAAISHFSLVVIPTAQPEARQAFPLSFQSRHPTEM